MADDDARTRPLAYGRAKWALEFNAGTEKEGFEPSMEAFTPITP
jgi:hypothetical protein